MNLFITQVAMSISRCIEISNKDAIYLIALIINRSNLFTPPLQNVTVEKLKTKNKTNQIKNKTKIKRSKQ